MRRRFTILVISLFTLVLSGIAYGASKAVFIDLGKQSPPHASWTLPTTESGLTNLAYPEYNMNLKMNAKLPKETFNTWRILPSWKRYLYKNRGLKSYLAINLQGTVFLVPQTPPSTAPAADIPVDATIVAEFVPVKKAVLSGIVPFYSQPLNDIPLTSVWMHVLGTSNPNFRTW